MPYPVAAARGGKSSGRGTSSLLTGLVGYWPMDEAAGANDVLDAHGIYDFTQTNSPGADTGKLYPTARAFAKASEQCAYIARPDALSGGADFTVMAWFKLASWPGASPGYYMIFSCATNTGWTGWELLLVYNSILQAYFGVTGTGAAYGPHSVGWAGAQLNTWYSVIAWHVYADKTSYIQLNDDVPVSATGVPPMNASIATNIYVSRHYQLGDKWFDGALGPLAFWNRILSAAERVTLRNGGAGLAYPF